MKSRIMAAMGAATFAVGTASALFAQSGVIGLVQEAGMARQMDVPEDAPDGKESLERLGRAMIIGYRMLVSDVWRKMEDPEAYDAFQDGNPPGPIVYDEARRERLNALAKRYREMRSRMNPKEEAMPKSAIYDLDPGYFDELTKRTERMRYGEQHGGRGLIAELQAAVDRGDPAGGYYDWQLGGVRLMETIWSAGTGSNGEASDFSIGRFNG